jgi:RNA polymerase sigma-70 factor (ECF subfamily)
MTPKDRTAPPLRVVRTPLPAPSTRPMAPAARQDAEPASERQDDLDALYRRYSRYVAAVATRLLGRGDEVDDLVQDVFLAALRGISRMRDPQAIKGWLAKVTVRLALKRLRRRRLLQALHLERELADYQQLAAAGTSAVQRDLLAKVYHALDKLPAQTRVIWLLRHVLDEPLQGIVELSACSQSTVQRKLRDAESFLAKELHDA